MHIFGKGYSTHVYQIDEIGSSQKTIKLTEKNIQQNFWTPNPIIYFKVILHMPVKFEDDWMKN